MDVEPTVGSVVVDRRQRPLLDDEPGKRIMSAGIRIACLNKGNMFDHIVDEARMIPG